jgi:hypothetical protein
MNISFEEIGSWGATFACGEVAEGDVVTISAGGTVGPCSDGGAFCGVVAAMGRDQKACTVTLGGMVSATYSGSDPLVGLSKLSANGSGGVKADESGTAYWVAQVDTTAKIVTFKL